MLKRVLTAFIGLAMTPEAFAARPTVAIVDSADVAQINGGINPDAFAYEVTARVMIGGNRCLAKGVTASLGQKTKDGVIHVVAYTQRAGSNKPRVCTREFEPIYATITTTVRALRTQISDVVIDNIGERGASTSVDALLDQNAERSYTAYLDRVMAVGGESTGYAVVLPTGESIEVDLQTNNLDRTIAELEGQNVTVIGTYKTVLGVESGARRVFEATSIEAAPQ